MKSSNKGQITALERLVEASNKLWNMHNLHDGLIAMLDASIQLLSADYGNVQLLDPATQILHIAVQRGFKREFLEFFKDVSAADDSACGRSLRTRKRIIIKDVSKDTGFAPYAAIALRAGYRAVQSTPLVSSTGKPFGMLSTHFKNLRVPSKEELLMLDLYVRQASAFIERIYLEQQKDNFMNMASHELKTPLTSTKILVQYLLKHFTSEPKVQEIHKKINAQIDRLSALVRELLDATRLEQGKLELHNEVFLVKDIFGEIIEDLQEIANHHIVFNWQTKLKVNTDKERIRQILINLVTNAVKYSPKDTDIIISSQEKDGSLVVSVQDFGIGIPESEKQYVFDRFYQISQNNRSTYPGMGLGLFIVKEILTRMGGNIWFESENGKGSTFYFSLPIFNS